MADKESEKKPTGAERIEAVIDTWKKNPNVKRSRNLAIFGTVAFFFLVGGTFATIPLALGISAAFGILAAETVTSGRNTVRTLASAFFAPFREKREFNNYSPYGLRSLVHAWRTGEVITSAEHTIPFKKFTMDRHYAPITGKAEPEGTEKKSSAPEKAPSRQAPHPTMNAVPA